MRSKAFIVLIAGVAIWYGRRPQPAIAGTGSRP